ncbi:zinc ribbon domain-containing protein [Ekhidna sp.]|jgi:hypothetical protein|uniref:zinc ribbon domain-containing protein n=1 Tax=Ekhidna sp. TaxID=2608089 RepID=UPI0032EC92DF
MLETNLTCSNCQKPINESDTYCGNCGFPENGSDEEKNKFHYRIKLKTDVVKDAEKKIKNVKTLLFVLAGLNILLGFYFIFILDSNLTFADGVGLLISALVFIGCAIWVNKQPLMGVLAAFGFYLFLQVLAAVVDPSTILQGLLLKIIIIGVFIKGINSARDAKKYREQLAEMGATHGKR